MNVDMKKPITCVLSLLLLLGCSRSFDGELIFVEPGPEDGFNFPYFLFIPDKVPNSEKVYVIIEPNNSGFVNDDLQEHREKAKRTATKDFYLGNHLSRKFRYPLLVPVFPRPETEWKIYTHALDRDVMLQEDNPLERIDLQLICMLEDARIRLDKNDIPTHDRFLLTGFSAAGTFANRFTLLHPDKVFAVAAGGLNGLLMLPVDSLHGELLKYPIGTGDLKELTGQEFRKTLFINTPQFYFLGSLDDNDAILYDDGYDSLERDQIFRLLGEQMQPLRWDKCSKIYADSNVNAIIMTYDSIGHEHPEQIKTDISAFLENYLKDN